MLKHKRALLAGLLIFFFAALILFGSKLGYYWLNSGRSPDRYGVLHAMWQSQRSDLDVVRIRNRPDMLLVRTGTSQPYRIRLNAYLQSYGWEYEEQMGASIYYRKNRKRMRVEVLAMSKYFQLITLPHQP